MANWLQRLFGRHDNQKRPVKAAFNPASTSFGGSYWYSGINQATGELWHNDYGAASAAILESTVYSCMRARIQALEALPQQIVERDTDEPIWKDGDLTSDHPFARALLRFRQEEKHDYFAIWEYSQVATGKWFTQVLNNRAGVAKALTWYNPLGMQIIAPMGIITGYMYSGQGATIHLGADEVIYDKFFNLVDETEGQSPIEAAIDSVNISRQQKRALLAYYHNGMQLGRVISPASDLQMTDEEFNLIRRELQARNKGAGNWFNDMITNSPMNVDSPPAIKFDDNDATVRRVHDSIHKALGVPPAVTGDTSATTYKESLDVYQSFYDGTIIPRARSIERVVNMFIMPLFDPSGDSYFRFDVSEWTERVTDSDRAKRDVALMDLNAGAITLLEYKQRIGEKVDDADKAALNIRYMPVDKQIVRGDTLEPVSWSVPTQEANTDIITNAEAPVSDGETDGDVGGSDQVDQHGTAIPQGEVFGYHVDSGIVDINEARAQLGLPPVEQDETVDLAKLRNQLDVARQAVDAGLSREAALELVGLDAELNSLEPDATPDAQRDELKAWLKFLRNGSNKNRAFRCDVLRGDVEHYIRAALADDNNAGLKVIFDAAFKRLDYVKAIQATRLDFENSVEDVIAEARAGTIDRRRFGTIMRALIRRFGRQAYVDGLVDGGIQDGATGSEEEAEIQQLVSEQSQYVTQLGAVLYSDDGITDAQAALKPAEWYNKSISPFYTAGIASADRNGYYLWTMNPAKENCTDCAQLNGQIHRMRDYVRSGWLPKADKLECGGFQCGCNLIRQDNARARGRFPRKSVHVHGRACDHEGPCDHD